MSYSRCLSKMDGLQQHTPVHAIPADSPTIPLIGTEPRGYDVLEIFSDVMRQGSAELRVLEQKAPASDNGQQS